MESGHCEPSSPSRPSNGVRKYVVACAVCGCLCASHGVVFVVLYLLLRSYTSSLHFFETVPTYLPGGLFIITGIILTGFVKRRNRYGFLLKASGGCCGVCALLCVVITVTTTVVHMHRLQTLRECVYTALARTCVCAGNMMQATTTEDVNSLSERFVFHRTASCEVVHGVLYACLRALFCCAVLGVLLCIACAMLLYQLSTHEKKRLYCRQLELRRRFLYQRHHSNICCYDDPLWPPMWTPHATEPPQQPPARGGWWPPWRRRRQLARRQQPPTQEEDLRGGEWRSECIHIFPSVAGGHRRTRSNDGVFHHLHMVPRYAQPYSVVDPAEIPRYLWGPPPPYSQPQSQENIATREESPKDTPLAQRQRRRFLCHDFTAPEGGGAITLHIGTPHPTITPPTDPASSDKKDTCVVEVHRVTPISLLPRPLRHTLPMRHAHRRPPFRSLTNLPPLCSGRGLLTLSSQLDRPPPTQLIMRGLAQSMPDLRPTREGGGVERGPQSGAASPEDHDEDGYEEDSFVVCSSGDDEESSSSCGGGLILVGSSSVVVGARPPLEWCPLDCAMRHLHHYRRDSKIEVRQGGRTEHAFELNSDFVVTIKSVNV